MKKTTLLMIAILSCNFSLYAQSMISSVGDNDPKVFQVSTIPEAPCSQQQVSNAFENGLFMEAGGQLIANDFLVDPDINFTVESLTANLLAQGGLASLDVIFYDNVAGLPGTELASYSNIVPDSQDIIGSNFGFDVHETVLTIPPTVFEGGAAGDTFWVQLIANPAVSGTQVAWEVTTVGGIGLDVVFDNGAGVFAYSAGNDGVFTIEGDCSPPGPNTSCGFAETAVLGTNNAIGMNNTDAGAVNACFTGAIDALWYRYTAPETGDLTISSDINGQTQNTRLSVYDSCTDLNCLASDDDGGANGTSIVTLSLSAGETVFFEWDDANDESDFDFEVSFDITCAAPTNFMLTNEAGVTADFSWDDNVDATNGYVFSVFNSGDDPDVDTPVYTENIAAGTSVATATGLAENTTYDAYVAADCDTGGTSASSQVIFATGFLPPSCGGNFYDTGGPDGDFDNNENYTITILPDDAGDVVTATFTFVDNGSPGFDELTVDIGDGNPQVVPNIPAGDPPISYTSIAADGSLFFSFTSTGVVPNPGWEADITCGPPPTCLAPQNVSASNITTETADISWDEEPNASNGYIIEVFNFGDDPDVDTPVYTNTVAFGTTTDTATGLTAATEYTAYVTADCDVDGTSMRSEVSFFTQVAPPECGGNFYDTGGPGGDFDNNEDYDITIFPDNAGDIVTATFTFVDNGAPGFDELLVDIGDGNLQVVPNIPAGDPPISYTSIAADGSLFFSFTSTGVVPNPGWEADITCEAGPARVQVIHNSPDPTVEFVDVYLNDDLLLDDFQFRTATSFINAPAGVPLTIDVAPSDSNDSGDSIFELVATLDSGETYIVVADGVVTNPDAGEEFSIEVFAGARENGTDPNNTDVLVHHGSPDAPTVDIVQVGDGNPILVDDISYPEFAGYLSVPTADYTVSVTTADNSTEVAAYSAPLATLGQQGEAITVLASGFLAPEAGEPEFGLWVALPVGGNLIPLPTAALSINGNTIEGLRLYPNPTADVIHITAQDNVSQIEIFNMLGQRVFTQKANTTMASFDLSGLSAGNYILKATVGNQIGNYQIIKK